MADNNIETITGFKVSDEQLESIIFNYCNDLTKKVRAGKTEPIIGRDTEIDHIVTALLQRNRCNVALLGGAGVGKTALFTGLARAMALEKMPKPLIGARVIEMDLAAMAAGTASRSEFEGRVIPLIKGVAERNATRARPPIILCIDELHTTMRASQSSSASGIADVMKPYLTEGSLRIVGATTELEYNEFLKKDQAMDRRFQKIFLKEPNEKETIVIMKGVRAGYEKHFQVKITDEAIEKIVGLTNQFIRNRNNPDKSLMVLDTACALFVRKDAPGGVLDNDSVVRAVAAEANLPVNAIE